MLWFECSPLAALTSFPGLADAGQATWDPSSEKKPPTLAPPAVTRAGVKRGLTCLKLQSQKDRRERGRKNMRNFVKDINVQIQEAQWILRRNCTKKITPRHIIVNYWKPNKKRKYWKHPEKNDIQGNNNSNNVWLLCRNNGADRTGGRRKQTYMVARFLHLTWSGTV